VAGTGFDADRLPPEEIERLKQKEREGRDAGADSYLARIHARGRFRIHAEDLTIARHLAPRPTDQVLDAGAGVGRHALRLAPRVRRVVCLDFSAEALRVLRDDAARLGLVNIETRVADVCAIDEDLAGFDTVFISEVLQHVPSEAERLKAMEGFHRALRPGGRCVVNVLCWNPRARRAKDGISPTSGSYVHYSTPAEVRDWFVRAGFEGVSVHGMLLLPGRVTRRLPPGMAWIEAALSGVAPLAGMAAYLIGVGRRPAS
jgi:2-polyprenyl-3-methyl-5-hydroxy-6-metoxy-1,4-benzoquinol methylase